MDRLGKEGLRDLGFDVPVGKITARQFMASYRPGSQLPSTSDITGVNDIELQEIVENALRSIENLSQQVQEEPTEDLPMHDPGPVWPMHELFGVGHPTRKHEKLAKS